MTPYYVLRRKHVGIGIFYAVPYERDGLKWSRTLNPMEAGKLKHKPNPFEGYIPVLRIRAGIGEVTPCK